jgi:2-polyprenyl-3-methyl-5-hydroxy-6-metoxy-1,4-benzoquinol methylase
MDLQMRSRACPVCGSDHDYRIYADARFDASRLGAFAFSSRKLPEYMHYRMNECRRCDSLYANPLPTRESLQQAYAEAAFDTGDEARYASQAYAEFLPAILARIEQREAALDIGTGDGAFLEQLERHGFRRLVGVEPSAAPVARAKPQIRPLIRHAPFRASDFEPGSFSLITCFQTLEHVDDPQSLCERAHALLHEGGALFVVSHNRRALSARLLGRWSPIFDIEHLQLFSPKSLRYALERAGFSDVELYPVRNRYPLRYWIKLLPIPAAIKLRALARLDGKRLGELPVRIAAGNFAAVAYKRAAASKH